MRTILEFPVRRPAAQPTTVRLTARRGRVWRSPRHRSIRRAWVRSEASDPTVLRRAA